MKWSFGSLPRWMRTSTPSSVSAEPNAGPNDRRRRHSLLLQFDGCRIPRRWLTVKSQVGFMGCSHHMYISILIMQCLFLKVWWIERMPCILMLETMEETMCYFWMEWVLMVLRRMFINDPWMLRSVSIRWSRLLVVSMTSPLSAHSIHDRRQIIVARIALDFKVFERKSFLKVRHLIKLLIS